MWSVVIREKQLIWSLVIREKQLIWSLVITDKHSWHGRWLLQITTTDLIVCYYRQNTTDMIVDYYTLNTTDICGHYGWWIRVIFSGLFFIFLYFQVSKKYEERERERGVFWLRTGIGGPFCEHGNTMWRIYPVASEQWILLHEIIHSVQLFNWAFSSKVFRMWNCTYVWIIPKVVKVSFPTFVPGFGSSCMLLCSWLRF
jgi:hypothetical protein